MGVEELIWISGCLFSLYDGMDLVVIWYENILISRCGKIELDEGGKCYIGSFVYKFKRWYFYVCWNLNGFYNCVGFWLGVFFKLI